MPAAASQALSATEAGTVNALGADLLSAYQLLTLISALYAQAGAFDQKKQNTPMWNELTDRIIADLGELYSAWDDRIKDASTPSSANPQRHVRLARCARRVEVLTRGLDLWTPSHRWATVLRRLEACWQRRVSELFEAYAADQSVTPKLGRVLQTSIGRETRLSEYLEKSREERDRLQLSYRLSDPHADRKKA